MRPAARRLGLVSLAGLAASAAGAYRLAATLRRSRMRSEGARVESERARQVSDAILGAIQDGLVIYGLDGRAVRVNARMCELTGFSAEEIVGVAPPLPYWPPEAEQTLHEAIADAFERGSGEYDVVLCRKSGERFPAIVTVGVTPDRASRVVMMKDVAERAALVAETSAVREAFARSAEAIGEYLYSGERLPDEGFVMHAHGPGLAALLGAAEETHAALRRLRRRSCTPTIAMRSRPPGASPTCSAAMARPCSRTTASSGSTAWPAGSATAQPSRCTTGACCSPEPCATSPTSAAPRTSAPRPCARLEWLSSVDALTELFNRRHFSEVLRARLAGSAAGAAIALVDVDHFKRVNDSHGHQIGDAVLREIARRLDEATRPCDVTSRWGGEEFCVLLDEITDEQRARAPRRAPARIGLGDADRRRRAAFR